MSLLDYVIPREIGTVNGVPIRVRKSVRVKLMQLLAAGRPVLMNTRLPPDVAWHAESGAIIVNNTFGEVSGVADERHPLLL